MEGQQESDSGMTFAFEPVAWCTGKKIYVPWKGSGDLEKITVQPLEEQFGWE